MVPSGKELTCLTLSHNVPTLEVPFLSRGMRKKGNSGLLGPNAQHRCTLTQTALSLAIHWSLVEDII